MRLSISSFLLRRASTVSFSSWLTSCLVLIPASSFAEDILLDDLIVEGSRLSDDRRSVQVLTETDLKRSQAQYLGDLLRREAGVDFNSNQSGNASATIRGGSSSHTLVYIDGVRVNDPSDPTRAFDFANLDLSQVERVEIFKGPQSVSFGSDALSGVIFITTKKKARKEASFSIADPDHYRTHGAISTYLVPELRTTLRLSRQNQGGQSTAAVAGGDIDESQLTTGGVDLDYEKSDIKTSLGLITSYQKQDLDAGAFTDDGDARSLTLQNIANLKFQKAWEQKGQTKLILSRKTDRRAYIGGGDAVYKSYLLNLDLSHRFYLTSTHELVVGGEWRREDTNRIANLYSRSAFIQNRMQLIEGLTNDVGLRMDQSSAFASTRSFRLGLEKSFGQSTRLNVSIGNGFKAPPLFSLYDPTYGNPKLRPEQSTALEAGVEQDIHKKHSLKLTAFQTRYKDLLGYDPATFISINVAEAQVRGLELETRFEVSKSLNLRTHFTYLRATDLGTNEELPKRARFKTGVIADYQISDQARVQGEFFSKSSRRDTNTSSVRAGGYSLVHLAGSYDFTKKIQGTLKIENLLGRDYVESVGYTTAERLVWVGANISL